jgi:glycosyltransferase involved in cell wall biosynthesis
LIMAPFFGNEGAWIDDFCHRPDFEFKKARTANREVSWHIRGDATPLLGWVRNSKYAYEAMKWKSDCIVTSFPQLAFVAAGLLQLWGARTTRLIAWNFNLGSISSEWKGRVAGRILDRVDRFVVHAREEMASYARWLGISQERFRFVPLQKGRIAGLSPSPIQAPYIVSMGSANRDYRTLVDALLGTGLRTVIISKKSVIESLPEHPDLVKLHGLTQEECNSVLSGAHLNVVPISATQTASGQVTFVTSMRLGIPTIATRCLSTIDYIRNGETGLLVPPGDAAALRRAIEAIWQNEGLRLRIGAAGRDYAEEHFSDEAAGRHFAQIIDEVLAEQYVTVAH